MKKLRWQLSYHIKTIQVVMSFAQWYAVGFFSLHPFQFSLTGDYLWSSVTTDEMGQQTRRTLVDCLVKRLPISIGYTWEGGTTVDTAPIQLRDMYDHVFDVPMDLCATPEVLYPFRRVYSGALTFREKLFDAMLRSYFYGRTGNRFVVEGDYELTTAGSSSPLNLIEPAAWTTTMKPGIVVEMSAIIRRKSRSRLRSDVECPCCRRIVPGVTVDVRTVW